MLKDRLKDFLDKYEKQRIKFEKEIKEGDTTFLISTTELEVGSSVYILSESGEKTPAPDGEHKIEGKIIITENGVITEIKEEGGASDEPVDGVFSKKSEMEEEITDGLVQITTEEADALVEVIGKSVDEIMALEEKVSELTKIVEEEIIEMRKFKESFSKSPSGSGLENPKKGTSSAPRDYNKFTEIARKFKK